MRLTIGGGVLCIDGEPVAKLTRADLVALAGACIAAMQGWSITDGQQGLEACTTTVELRPVD